MEEQEIIYNLESVGMYGGWQDKVIGKKLEDEGLIKLRAYGLYYVTNEGKKELERLKNILAARGQPLVERTEPKGRFYITAEDLVYSMSREEIQDKLQKIFGTYKEIEYMEFGEIPMSIEADVAAEYMPDIEHAAAERNLPETREILRRAYEEIAKGYAKAGKKAQARTIPASGVPHQKLVAEFDRKYTLDELKVFSKDKGLPTSGDKKALIRRLFF